VALSGQVDARRGGRRRRGERAGVVGDRRFAVVDSATGLVAGAKNPNKWDNFFDFRATYVEPSQRSEPSAVQVTLPDGTAVLSEQPELGEILSRALGREVALVQAQHGRESSAEEYWPDMEGLDHRDTVTDWQLPAGTFFDLATIPLLTTETIDRLRSLYPGGASRIVVYGRTSSWRPMATASSRTNGSTTPSRSATRSGSKSPVPARAAS
jgi:hypothetical protein